MAGQLVTIAVVPRERFSVAKRSLESVLAHRDSATDLIYIDGGSPPLVRQYLEQQAARHSFRLLSTERYVSPNVARNLAAAQVRTKYVAFVDNDVLVSPKWLERLVDCAESTDAWIVGPVCCQGEPVATTVRSTGATAEVIDSEGRPALVQQHRHDGRLLTEVASALARGPVGQVELHATLVRMDALSRLGPLDERLASAAEHTDLCLLSRRQGGAVYLEPGAVVTYLPPPPFEPFDLPYFQLRWSDAWNQATIRRFGAKWGLPADDPGLQTLGEQLDNHRRLTLEPYRRLLRWLGSKPAKWIERALIAPVEQATNRRRFPNAPQVAKEVYRRAA
jgi:glycosyltransferase involved in cell wall biosynthesis